MKKNIEQLLADHRRLIESEASKYAKFVPISLAQVEAYKLAREAAEQYDPETGLKFSTFLVNMLKKLSRLSTQYGSIVRLPENKQFKLQRVNQAEKNLTEQLGRNPSIQEIADETGLNLPTITGLLQGKKKEINMSNLAFSPVVVDDNSDQWVHFVYHDLPDRDKVIFEHKTGYGGKQTLSNDELAAKLHLPVTTIAHRVKFITNKINEGLE